MAQQLVLKEEFLHCSNLSSLFITESQCSLPHFFPFTPPHFDKIKKKKFSAWFPTHTCTPFLLWNDSGGLWKPLGSKRTSITFAVQMGPWVRVLLSSLCPSFLGPEILASNCKEKETVSVDLTFWVTEQPKGSTALLQVFLQMGNNSQIRRVHWGKVRASYHFQVLKSSFTIWELSHSRHNLVSGNNGASSLFQQMQNQLVWGRYRALGPQPSSLQSAGPWLAVNRRHIPKMGKESTDLSEVTCMWPRAGPLGSSRSRFEPQFFLYWLSFNFCTWTCHTGFTGRGSTGTGIST